MSSTTLVMVMCRPPVHAVGRRRLRSHPGNRQHRTVVTQARKHATKSGTLQLQTMSTPSLVHAAVEASRAGTDVSVTEDPGRLLLSGVLPRPALRA